MHQRKINGTEKHDHGGKHTRPDGDPNSKDNMLFGLQMEKVMIDTSIVDLQTSIDKATELGLVTNASTELLALKKTLQADVITLKDDLEGYKDIDPMELDKKREAIAVMKRKAELWTNNIELLEGWLERALGAEPAQLDFLRREIYGAEYLDGEVQRAKAKRDRSTNQGIKLDDHRQDFSKDDKSQSCQTWLSSQTPDSELVFRKMGIPEHSHLPPEVILRIFKHADDFATVNALVRTSSIFYCVWLLNANSIVIEVLPNAIESYHEARGLVQAQEHAELCANTHEKRNRSHREVIIILVRRYLTNARLVCSVYESNLRPVLVDLTAKGHDVTKMPLLQRTRFIGTLYRFQALALAHQYSDTDSPFLSHIRRPDLIDMSELASWFRRVSTLERRTELGIDALLQDTRYLPKFVSTAKMNTATQAPRRYQRRSAYQPTDPMAYVMLAELHCIRSETADLGAEVRLCSLCMEVALGESLLDENDKNTEHRIAFYQLPCGHLRCCSCALTWLDRAGIFHRICHLCDSQQTSISPDLSVVLDTIETRVEPDMSWIKGFYSEKRKNPRSPNAWPEIHLPPIQEVNAIDLSTLALETPIKKRPRERRRMPMPSSIELFGCTAPPRLQWTPKAQRDEEVLEYMHEAISDLPSSDDENDGIVSVKVQKKHKISTWANSPEKPLPDQSFEEWIEEEELMPRKRLRHAL
ncbi:MAG: hypothetical protein Q9186_003941 [Xanthomendoza sp. 1 TL-2023]